MTLMRASTCAALCLLLSACGTPAPKQLTLPPTERVVPACPELTLCRLPGRSAPRTNEEFDAALVQTEAALLQCAAKVDGCVRKQEAATDAAAR